MPVKGMWNGWLTQKSSASVLGKSFGNSLFSDYEAGSQANQIYYTEGFLAVQSSIYKNFLKLTGDEKISVNSHKIFGQKISGQIILVKIFLVKKFLVKKFLVKKI